MLGYIVHRILIMVPTLVVISIAIFTIIHLPPGDYFSTYIAELQSSGEKANLAKIAFLKAEYGFDLPVWQQYLYWVGGLLRGDMGYSLTFVGFLGLATPSFLLALVLVYFAHVWFGISVGGLMDPHYLDQPWSMGKALSVAAHIWIPVVVIGTAGTAAMIRRLRANLLDELQKQYVVTARAKGLHPLKVLFKYPLRMALNPFISDIGSLLPQVISGAVIVSVVMSLPTTGPMLLDALRSQDMYLAGSFLMFMSFLTVIGVFLSDLALATLDPRIRLQSGRRQ
jgi:peptide/nickel transport system permease protein